MSRLPVGTTFGNYTIQGLIAGGGMGEVYAARDEVYGSTVALKLLHQALHEDPSWRKRFNEEGLVGTQLKHPHVLSARELVEADGRIALVMDLVSGGQTLDTVVGREFADGMPLVAAMQVFLAIVQGIEYLHGKDIVHGDLKPENVMVEGDYRDPSTWAPKVTDFGTVSLIADPVTIGGRAAVVATPRYAAPEHLLGVDKIEKRSDIYALGLVLHFLLTGRHCSAARTVEEALRQTSLPVPIVALVDQPDTLIAMFQRACAIEPDERFQSCRELALAVREVLDSVGAVLELDDLQADLATEVDEERAALMHAQRSNTSVNPGEGDDDGSDSAEGGEPVTDPDEHAETEVARPAESAESADPPNEDRSSEDPPSDVPTDAGGPEPFEPEESHEADPTYEPEPEAVASGEGGASDAGPAEDPEDEMERTTPSARPAPEAAAASSAASSSSAAAASADTPSDEGTLRPSRPPVPAPAIPADAPDDGRVPAFVWLAGTVAVLVLLVVIFMNIPG